jgi:CheY-like chemotaxis protein
VPDLLIGDPGRLRQVLVNLIGNGVKFADRGDIAVSVSCQPAPGDNAVELHVRVRDSGIGIPPSQHATIFEPFEQADGSATRRYGGTGLGLAIARQLVGLMDGVIGVESDVGSGSTFHFTARLRRSAQQPIAKEAAASGVAEERERAVNGGLRILLVEDNLVNQRVATRLLEKKGHQVSVADNGRAALHAYTRAPYDVVLMDVQMPEMDGLEATAAIRRHEADCNGAGRRVPIIAMTAHALSGDRERCLAAGMDDYVSKPIQSRALFGAIERVLSN